VAGTATGPVTAAESIRPRTRSSRVAVLAATLAGLLIANLVVYAIGRALGGSFTYPQNGTATRVDPAAIAIMSLGPLGGGLAVVAALSRAWPAAVRAARIAAPILAVGTIAAMTIPAGFDTTSTVCLALMHLTTIPAALVALNALPRRRGPRARQAAAP